MEALNKTLAIVEAALEKRALDLKVMQVEHLRSVADYFVIATGRSDVQVQAIARGIEERMAQDGVRPLAVEGFNHGHWIVLDYDDVVIHIFFEPVREFYRLESNWTDAQDVPLPAALQVQVRDLSLRNVAAARSDSHLRIDSAQR